MLRSARKGFLEAEAVKAELSKPDVIEQIAGKGAKVKDYTNLKASAGGSQSQLGRVTLEDNRVFFVKQSIGMEDITRQKTADANINAALGDSAKDSAFVYMLYGGSLGSTNGISVFPNVNGFTLYDAFSEQRSKTFPVVVTPARITPDKKMQAYQSIGAAIGKIHINGMKNNNELEQFYENGCDLNGKNILVHNDLQASNIMFSEDGKIYFVDTIEISVEPNLAYQNIYELMKEMTDDNAIREAILEGYLSNFKPDKQDQVLSSIKTNLENDVYQFTLPKNALPSTPVNIGDLSKINYKPPIKEEKTETPTKTVGVKRTFENQAPLRSAPKPPAPPGMVASQTKSRPQTVVLSNQGKSNTEADKKVDVTKGDATSPDDTSKTRPK